METKKLKARASIQIQKTPKEVFEAIVDGEIMKHYFIASSTGRLEAGKTVAWTFPEFPESFPVEGRIIKPGTYISFDWSDGIEGNLVEIFLNARQEDSTVIKVLEHAAEYNEEGVQWVVQQTEGWANFLACMKAWLEYGIHLRKGAFDFMRGS